MAVYGVSPMLPNLPQELQQRRSMQASGLQAAQAQMGVPGQSRPGTSGGGGASNAGNPTFSGIMQERRQQAESMQARQADLQLGERLLQVLDPRLPKQARQFLFKELSRQIGVDPKGERSKEIGGMLTSLDPQVSEQVRRSISQQIQSAEPGQVTEMTRGILTGQVPVTQLVQSMSMPVAQQEGGGDAEASTDGFSPPMRLGGPMTRPAGADSAVTPAQAPGRPGDSIAPGRGEGPYRMPFQAAPSAGVGTVPAERVVPPLLRQVAPELVSILGIDPTQAYRVIDIYRGGWSRVPSDFDAQQRLATDIRGVQDGIVNMTVMGNQLVDIIRGRPEVLTLGIGRIPVPFSGTWNLELPNPSSVLTQLGSFGNSLAKTFGWEGTRIDPQSEDGSRVLSQSRELADRVFSWSPEVQRNANDTAVMQSLLINIAFAMAASKGQTGRFLSDRDVELQLQELGRSADPEQFSNTVSRVIQRAYDQYRVRMRAQTGGDVPVAPIATEDARAVLMNGQVTPRRMIQEFGGTGQEDRSFTRPPPPAPTGGEIMSIRGQPPPAAQGHGVSIGGEFETFPGTGTTPPAPAPATGVPSTMPDLRAPLASDEPLPRRGPLSRQSPTVEEEEIASRGRLEEDRAARIAHQANESRRLEIAESGERRAARGEERAIEEMRRRRIQEAFASIAQALRSSAGGGISVGSAGAGAGGDQDAAAFRVAPAPQRRPPTPIDASQFLRRR